MPNALLKKIGKIADQKVGKHLPVNVTGAIAAISLDMGVHWQMSKSFAILGRALGGRAGSAILSPDATGDLASVALTLNYKPVPNVKIQPEVRFDHTSYKDGFDGVQDRFIVGAGVSYLF